MEIQVLRRKLNTAWSRYNPAALMQKAKIAQLEGRAYLRDRQQRGYYHFFPPQDLLTARKISDAVFVFGSGSSLKDITPAEWGKIDQHNTLGWKSFVYQEYVHADYLILREIATQDIYNPDKLLSELNRIIQQARDNPRFANAAVFVQEGWRAVAGNTLFGNRTAPKDAFQYARFGNAARHEAALPGKSFSSVTHIFGTLTDAVNFAYLGGWRHIVLIGIDLYDSAYFLENEQEDHIRAMGTSVDAVHPTAKSGIVNKIGEWAAWLAERDRQISVYNPRSLMAEVMPVFDWDML